MKKYGLELPKHKVDVLTSMGFKRTVESEPTMSMLNVMVSMERWDCLEEFVNHKLYIHFLENEPAYCHLYSGDSEIDENFSERNLVSELKKRGFTVKSENE
ncbi:hypothetical protein [Bacillus thuringiensis]|uniref:hypothetical protein n=1 Tax=Bacillus thuringiensis TaxID=1428 RepID=UPI000BFCCBCC|nr:hypothetical protein [Bacillus thuringiensis]PGT90043.1 hypothetical protein COD17_09850 [Bacillus thuringiensis]